MRSYSRSVIFIQNKEEEGNWKGKKKQNKTKQNKKLKCESKETANFKK